MANTGTRLVEKMNFVQGLITVAPSSSTPAYISLKGYNHLTVLINATNTTGVTGSAITLKQATDIANVASDEKTLAFDTMWACVDTATSSLLVKTAVTSNTFTTTTTSSVNSIYIIEVDAETLDVDGGFDCVRLGTGTSVNATLTVTYILSGQRYQGVTVNRALATAN